MFLSREIDTKIHIYIYAILYKSSRFKHHIQKINNQSENDYIPQDPENLRFAPGIVFNF